MKTEYLGNQSGKKIEWRFHKFKKNQNLIWSFRVYTSFSTKIIQFSNICPDYDVLRLQRRDEAAKRGEW